MMKGWLLLLLAIILELCGTLSLKYSDGFTRVVPSVVMFICYAASFTVLNFAMKSIDVSVAYAIWSGLGTALITIAGFYLFGEKMTVLKMISIVIIIIGVVGLNIQSSDEGKTAIHRVND